MASFTGRVLRSRHLTTSILASTLYMTSTSLAADEGTSRVRPGFSSSGERLPIYPTPESNPSVTLVETPKPLVPYIAQGREAVSGVLGEARGYVQTGVSRWITFERRVEREVKSILPPDEPLNPGLIYILISGLSGSVLSRTRSLPIRFLSPPLFTLLAFPYFLPKTSHNIRQYLSDVEDKRFPEFAARHDHFVGTGLAHFGMLRSRIEDVGEDAREWGHKAFQGVEKTTGLRVGEVVSRVEKEKERLLAQQAKSAPIPQGGEQEYKTIGYVVEQKPVAEVVVPVAPEQGAKRIV
ncbi:hypothetical protein IAR55_001732 [Kwoniella newhampshirensis]|uniref:MICOS complex subunit n=1 Tax=Kwoniella newhampshirensis TaxID=1651941 RepID=A0AAW0Z2Y8_9TREE